VVRCKFLLVSLLIFASPWLYATTANTDTTTDTASAVTEWETSSTNQLPEQQTATTATAVVRYDSSAVHVRSTALDKYLSDSDFQYDNTGVVNPTLWEQFKAWLWSLLERFLSDNPDTVSTVWDWIYYILIAGVIIFVIFRLFGMTFTGAFRKSVQNGLAVELLGEDIHDMNFDQLIEEAAAQQNYRKAVRLLYLRTLKELTDREYIRWSPDKTNREYVHELSNSDMRKMFEHLTLLFEYIWYGDFPVDRTLFEQARSLFNDFRTTVTAQHV
jgi:hypothetical protein